MSRRRKPTGPPFVQMHHWLLDSAAWRALSPNARCVYLALKRFYDGKNNGLISFSARQAGEAIGASHHTGNRALAELVERGFIEITEDSNFDRKVRIARTYLLTETADDRPGQSRIASKAFIHSKENHSRMGERDSLMGATVPTKKGAKSPPQSHGRDCEPPIAPPHSLMGATHVHSSHRHEVAQRVVVAPPSTGRVNEDGQAGGSIPITDSLRRILSRDGANARERKRGAAASSK